jgi:hypothetical protein
VVSNLQATAICARLATFWDDELAGGWSSMVNSNTTHGANKEGVVLVLDLVSVSVRVPAESQIKWAALDTRSEDLLISNSHCDLRGPASSPALPLTCSSEWGSIRCTSIPPYQQNHTAGNRSW